MNKQTNGWLGEPGIPQSPEKTQYHWVRTLATGKLHAAYWNASEWNLGNDYFYPCEAAYVWAYVRPCQMPEEVDMLVARAKRDALAGPLADIAAERERQQQKEGWTTHHDDEHVKGEIALAAAAYSYATAFSDQERADGLSPGFWPASWSIAWFKPTTRRRDLVKAAALIVAEIERLDRAADSRALSDTPSGMVVMSRDAEI